MSTEEKWIDLDRRFEEERPGDVPSSSSWTNDRWLRQELQREISGGKGFTRWAGLEQMHCVVVCGEPGSGKSTEFRQRARVMRSEGKAAFEIRLRDVERDQESLFEGAGESERFKVWCDGSEKGWFFLDAADEAKLAGRGWTWVVERILGGVAERRARAFFLVSSRKAEWTSDERRRLSIALSGSDHVNPDDVRVFDLAPLDSLEHELLAKGLGVVDIENYLSAVRAADAEELVTRPVDVEAFVAKWNATGRIPKLKRDLLEFFVRHLLRPEHDDHRPQVISPARARECAERLAFTVQFSGRFLVRGPEARRSASPRDLDALRILSEFEFSRDEVDDLLRRPLFLAAGNGRFEFLHRSVVDFLCASWILREWENQKIDDDIEKDLFVSSPVGDFVRHHLAPVAAWIAPRIPAVRQRMIECCPENLVDLGDPRELDVGDREMVLQSLHRRFLTCDWFRWQFDAQGMKRFADRGLAPSVLRFLGMKNTSEELRKILLRLVAYAQIRGRGNGSEIVEVVIAIALDAERRVDVRCTAFDVLEALGTIDELREVKERISDEDLSIDRIAGAFIEALHPKILDLNEVVRIARSAKVPEEGFASAVSQALQYSVPRRLTSKDLSDYLRALLEGLRDETGAFRFAGGQFKIDDRRLLAGLRGAINMAVKAKFVIDVNSVILDFLDALVQIKESRGPYELKRLREDTPKVAVLRRAHFWAIARRQINIDTERASQNAMELWTRSAYLARHRSSLRPDDADYLLNTVEKSEVESDRAIAFFALTCVWGQRKAEFKSHFENLARTDVLLRRLLEHQKQVESIASDQEASFVQLEQIESSMEKGVRPTASRKEKEQALASLTAISNGTHIGWLRRLRDIGTSRTGADADEQPRFSPEKIRDFYDSQELAAAAVQGFRSLWRQGTPAVCDDKPQTSETDLQEAVDLAMTGLDFELSADLGAWPLLTPAEAAHAARFAALRRSSLPRWASGLIKKHQETTLREWSDILSAESISAMEKERGRLIDRIATADREIRNAISPSLARLIQSVKTSIHWLSRAMQMLVGTAPQSTEFVEIVRRNVTTEFGSSEDKRRAIWIVSLMAVARSSTELTISIPWSGIKKEDRRRTAIEVVSLHSKWFPIETDHDAWRKSLGTSDHWGGIARCLWTDANADDFVVVRNSEPWMTSNLAEARSFSIRCLASFGDDEAEQSLGEILKAVRSRAVKSRVLREIDTARKAPFVVRFDDSEEIANRMMKVRRGVLTDSDLFDLVRRHLEILRKRLARSDFSVREVLSGHRSGKRNLVSKDKQILPENHFQRWLAWEFDRDRSGRFSVSREECVDRDKRTDIRITNPRCHGPVTIEIKIADKWTFEELDETIEKQLVDRYLIESHSRFGVLVLVRVRRMNWPIDGSDETFDRVLDRLKAHAEIVLCRRRPSVRGLAVCGFDLLEG